MAIGSRRQTSRRCRAAATATGITFLRAAGNGVDEFVSSRGSFSVPDGGPCAFLYADTAATRWVPLDVRPRRVFSSREQVGTNRHRQLHGLCHNQEALEGKNFSGCDHFQFDRNLQYRFVSA